MILLDTDTCIGILRGYDSVISRRRMTPDEVAISFMTVAELYYGAEKSSNPEKNFRLLEQFLLTVIIIQTDNVILREFGRLKAELERQGNSITDADLFIAATCLARCTMLITGNTNHYSRIQGLLLDNWLR